MRRTIAEALSHLLPTFGDSTPRELLSGTHFGNFFGDSSRGLTA